MWPDASITRTSARCLHPQVACERIREAAARHAPAHRYWAIVGNGANRIAANEVRIKLSELCYKSMACDSTEDKKHIDLSSEPLILVCAAGLQGLGHLHGFLHLQPPTEAVPQVHLRHHGIGGPELLAHPAQHLQGEAQAVLQRAAVLVGAPVREG